MVTSGLVPSRLSKLSTVRACWLCIAQAIDWKAVWMDMLRSSSGGTRLLMSWRSDGPGYPAASKTAGVTRWSPYCLSLSVAAIGGSAPLTGGPHSKGLC
jgi:hypothetical protein